MSDDGYGYSLSEQLRTSGIIPLPGTPDGDARIAESADVLAEIAQHAQPLQPTESRGAEPEPRVGRTVKAQRADTIPARATRWLWQESGHVNWLPLGCLSLLGGREGIGKSTWAYRIAGQVSRGTLPGRYYGTPKGVLIAATEDAWEQTIVPRLLAAEANMTRVFRVDVEVGTGALTGLRLPSDTAELEAIAARQDVALVLLDPLMGAISEKLNTHVDAQSRQALEPISRLAHDNQLTIIGLIHFSKVQGIDVLQRLMGSTAFSAVSRAVLICAQEFSSDANTGEKSADQPTFVFGQGKSNLGRRVDHCLRYEIHSSDVIGHDPDDGEPITSTVIRIIGTVDEPIDDIISRQESERQSMSRDTRGGHAQTWLVAWLTEYGPTRVALVIAAAKQEGYTESTLRRAARAANVITSPVEGSQRERLWSLPTAGGAGRADPTKH